jgi:hypothetical protein
LFALALVVPITAAYPESVQATFPSGDPLWSSPLVLWVGVCAGGVQLGTAACLVTVATVRRRLGVGLSESQARTLLNVEDVASMVGLVTGGFAIVLTIVFFSIGHAGVETFVAVTESAPQNPYEQTDVSVPVIVVGTAAAASACFVYLLSRHLRSNPS